MSRALLLQEATSCQKQQSKVLPTAVLTHLDSPEPLGYHQNGQQEGRLSSVSFCKSLLVWAASEEKDLPSCPQHKQGAMAAQARSNGSTLSWILLPKVPWSWESSVPKQDPPERDLKTCICPGKRWHDRCFTDFLIAPSYFWVFHKPPLLGSPPKAWLWRGCSRVRLQWCLVKPPTLRRGHKSQKKM